VHLMCMGALVRRCKLFSLCEFPIFFGFFPDGTEASAQQLCTRSQSRGLFQYANNVQKMFIVFRAFAMFGALGSRLGQVSKKDCKHHNNKEKG
jgi:hypothetical protein